MRCLIFICKHELSCAFKGWLLIQFVLIEFAFSFSEVMFKTFNSTVGLSLLFKLFLHLIFVISDCLQWGEMMEYRDSDQGTAQPRSKRDVINNSYYNYDWRLPNQSACILWSFPLSVMWVVLREYGVSGLLLRAIRSLYNRWRSLIRIAGNK